MKKLNFKWLLLSIILSIACITQVDAATRRYYCKMTYSWWTTSSAAIACYAWNDSGNNGWPGKKMTATGTSGEWYIDLDTKYTKVIFTRVNSAGDTYWSAKTGDLTLDENNYYTITSSSGVWDPSTVSGSWSKYAPKPAVSGTMNSWKPDADVFSGTSGSVTCSVTLAANSSYEFKVTTGTTWYGYGSSNGSDNHTYIGQTGSITLSSSGNNLRLLTAGAGNYVFTYNCTSHTLSVAYPSVTHPSSDYVYFKNTPGWNPFRGHFWGGTVGTAWGNTPTLPTFDFDGTDYYYAALGGNSSGLVTQKANDEWNYKTADLSVGTHKGLYQYYDVVMKTTESSEVAARWKYFTATLSLDHQGATNTPAPDDITVTYNASTNLTGDIITATPSKTGYTFNGYYTNVGGEGVQLIGSNEQVVASVSNYTDAEKKWIRTGSSVSTTVYAKWTQSVSLDREGASSGSTSVTVTYYSSALGSLTNPTKANYDFAGYWTGDNGTGSEVISTGKALQAGVTGYTGAMGIWTHTGSAPTLHAKWTETPRTITASATTGGSVGSTSYTAYVVTTCAISATADPGYYFTGWTTTSGSVTYADASSASTTITATSDAVIKANFSPVWTVSGSMDDPWNTTSHQITNITESDGVMTSGYVDIALAANTDYEFKVVNLEDNEWWGSSSSSNEINYSNKATAKSLSSDGSNNQKLRTATAGTYRFTWDVANSKVTVRYPHTAYKISINHGFWPATNTIGANTNPASAQGGTITSAVGSVTGSLQVDGAHGTQYIKSGENVTFTHSTAASDWAWYGWGSSFNNGTHSITPYTHGSGGVTINDASRTMTISSISADKTVYSFFKENVTTVTLSTANTNYGDLKVGGAAALWGSTVTVGATTTKTIKGEGKNGYMFSSWALSGGATKASGNLTDPEITIKGNGTDASSGTATASFEYGYVVRGTLNDDSGNGGLGGWGATDTYLVPLAGVGTYTATLNRQAKYKCKVYFMESDNDYWWGTDETEDIDADTEYTLVGGENNITFTTEAAGTHTFTYNFSTHAFTVSYPTVYTVTYDDNGKTGGAVPTDDTPYGTGETVTVLGNSGSLTKTGYTFVGWNTQSDGNGTDYSKDDTFTITDDITLYAKWKNNSHASKYTFSYGTTATPAWTTTAFAQVGSTSEWNITSFTMPNPSTYPQYYVGYEGWYANPLSTSSKSAYVNLTNLVLLPGTGAIGTATGATGKLVIWDNSSADNLYVGFLPDGYGLTYSSGTLVFGAADGNHMRQTNIVTLTSSDVSGSFKVGLKSSSSYVDCAKTATDNASALNTRAAALESDQSYPDIPNLANGLKGRFVMWDTNSDAANNWYLVFLPVHTVTYNGNGNTGGSVPVDNTEYLHNSNVTVLGNTGSLVKIGYTFAGWNTDPSGDGDSYAADATISNIGDDVTLYAKWTADNNTFNGNAGTTAWATGGNWSKGTAPSNDYSSVTINAPVELSTSVHIGQMSFGESGKLTIQTTGALEVAGTVTNTDASKIEINTNASNQGALILNNSAGTTKATVNLYSIAAYDSKYNFQYIAIPMDYLDVSSSFAGSGIYTYAWSEGSGWERRGYYDGLSAFEGIGITTNKGSASSYTMSGTLASTSNQSFTLAYTSKGQNMIGNSWTAPISIAALNGKITGNAQSTVYVYESGNWVGYPTGSAGTAVVPAMQAYTILATSGGGTLTLNYDEAVRGVGSSYRTSALRAPKRNPVEDMTKMNIYVTDGQRQTALRLFEDEQFTEAFDNGWEAIYLKGDGRSGQLYAQTDEQMTVLATPDLEGTVIGFIPGEATDYTISFSGDGEGYYLNDIELEQSTLIMEGNTYVFAPSENNAARFIISRTPIKQTPTGIDEVSDGSKARKQMINGVLYIIRGGRMYDATGNLVK